MSALGNALQGQIGMSIPPIVWNPESRGIALHSGLVPSNILMAVQTRKREEAHLPYRRVAMCGVLIGLLTSVAAACGISLLSLMPVAKGLGLSTIVFGIRLGHDPFPFMAWFIASVSLILMLSKALAIITKR